MSVQSLQFDASRRVYFANAAIYTRDEYDWWIKNTGQPSRLFNNGAFQEQEVGSYDLGLLSAWELQGNANGVKVGVVDINASHGQRILSLVAKTAPGAEVLLFPISRYYPDAVAPAIKSAALAGCKIIVLATGWATPDPLVKDACDFALVCGSLIVCSAPNAPQNVDAVPDYPTSWNLPNVLSVSSTDRSGLLYGWAAWGNNVVAAPGRNITAPDVNGTLLYSSGTSYAAPIAAGCLALLMARHPGRLISKYRRAVRETCEVAGKANRINPSNMLRLWG